MAEKIIVAGTLNGGVYANMHEQSRRVYDPQGIAPTQHTCGGGNLETKIIEPTICAMRGRNPDNPSDRTKGCPTEQRLEIGGSVSNTLTSVQKDNLVAEPTAYDEQNGYLRKDGTVGALTTDGSSPKHNNRVVEPSFRIRKLTPRECFRLMDFDDKDFDRAKAAGVSDSQLYKQAGNSIVVAVLEAIFREMLQGESNGN